MDETIMTIVLIVVILAVIGLMYSLLIYVLRAQLKRISAAWTKQGITFHKGPEHANYRGHASITVPLRGSSVLGLTDHELRLLRLIPHHEFVIPLAQITQIEQLRAWKGGYLVGSPVIVVHYHDGKKEDAIGFLVDDPQSWLDAIAAAARVPVP
jgi:hypothetical protein